MPEGSIERLKVVYRQGALTVPAVVKAMEAVLPRHQIPVTGFELRGDTIDLKDVPSAAKKRGRAGFDLTGHGFCFLLGSLPRFRLDFFQVESAPGIPWDEWVGELAASPDFVMAWVVDVDYDHWQNAKDPLQYTAAGKSYAHLPMKSNGLPPPLQQMVIDTSGNPGRWSYRNGWVEAVGAVMWLAESFWSLTGADRGEVVKSNWLRISNPIPSVTRVESADRTFATAEGASGDLQNRLRSLLFPSSQAAV